MQIKAAAKINLMLDILSKTDDGYHSLFMIMQSVGIYDIINVTKTATKKIEIECPGTDLPCDKKNIAYKAADNFFNETKVRNCGIKITVEKHIPSAAGLAGGSADGAAVIKALDVLFETNLSEKELCGIGTKTGADVPFCLVGGTMLAQDIGQVLSYLPPLGSGFFVLVKPSQDVSTKYAYDMFDSNWQHIRHLKRDRMLHAAAEGDIEGMCRYAGNVFEQFIEVYDRVKIKSVMRSHNAKIACMSGSGPTVYGYYSDKKDATAAYNEFKKEFPDTFLCEPVCLGTEIIKG